MKQPVQPDDTKFKELVLYIAKKSESDPDFGATKLNKLLFFSEFLAYGRLGRPITGQIFQKLEWGPAAKRLLPVQRELIDQHDCAIQVRDHYGYTQKRLVALREPRLSEFAGDEIAIIDEVLGELQGRTAVGVSELSHRFIGWQLAEMNEDIPYETALLSERPLTQAEKDYALGITP